MSIPATHPLPAHPAGLTEGNLPAEDLTMQLK